MASKKDRAIIFNKYGGKCAYCGDPLQKGWHVDEILPIRRTKYRIPDGEGSYLRNKKGDYLEKTKILHPERLHIDNQMPSCPSCNINKHSMSLEDFRSLISGFMKHLNEVNTQYKIAKRFGLVKETGIKVVFYFEKIEINAEAHQNLF